MAANSPTARRWAAVFTFIVATVLAAGCGGGFFGKTYEYEEDLYISLDGTADVIVNASIPALAILRGFDLDLAPAARVDRDKIRALYETPITRVTRVSRPWRRNGRPFVQVRVSIDDIRKLGDAAPFNWSRYELVRTDVEAVFRQTVGASAHRPGTLKNVGWNGEEVVAFRVHFPSRILDHNARDLETDAPSDIARGNILAWEQRLADRLDGQPVTIQVKMDPQSILYRTLWLFAGAFTAAVLLMVWAVWFIKRKGTKRSAAVANRFSLPRRSAAG
jgi:hypothetical protein